MNRPIRSDIELLNIQLRTLFRLDALGRLASINDPANPAPNPRVFVGTAGSERIVRVSTAVPESVCRRWLRCLDDAELRTLVEQHAPVTREYRGPAYVLPAHGTPDGPVQVGRDTPLHPELIARGWRHDEPSPYVGVVRDGLVVAVCFSARTSEEAAEAGVETVVEYRGQGLASEAVGAWAAAVQASGRFALYSTTWENFPSQRVAARLRAHEYGEDWHLT